MADWKTHLNYNYTPAYHAYAYGLLYPHGFDQNHGGGDAGVTNVRGNLAGPTAAYQAASAVKAPEEESPPHSPGEHAGNGQYHFQSSEFEYLGESTAERLIFKEQRQASVDERPKEARQAGSDTASDTETYISPGIETVFSRIAENTKNIRKKIVPDGVKDLAPKPAAALYAEGLR